MSVMAKAKPAQNQDTPLIFDITLNDTTLAGMVKRRAEEAKKHWNEKYDLEKTRENNRKVYTAESAEKKPRDERYQDVFSDNIVFKAVRTILSFIGGRITQPEVTPASAEDLSQQFATDFEKAMVLEIERMYGKQKVKMALEDLLAGQRIGILMLSYNDSKKKLELVHCEPNSVVIGSRSGLLDEPDFIQLTQKRSVAKLIQQFPDKKDVIYRLYGITKGVPSQLEDEKEITINWLFFEDEDAIKLGVIFMAGDQLLGKMSDPNWVEDGDNFIDEHMMPFIFFNFLNDGKGYIDYTSFLEQAQRNQEQYNKRGQTISENAEYAGVGVPVFAGGAIKEETAARLQFNPKQRVILSDDATNVAQAFTTWKADPLQQFVFEDKNKLEQSIYDTFGTNQVQTAGESNTNTLGEAVLLRNQAEGRQQELIDAVDTGMTRLYKLLAQMMYRYYDEEQFFNLLGDDGRFEQVVISQKKIADNIGARISVKSGTNMPVDRSQKIAIAKELMNSNRIGTLRLYKELGIENPEEAYKEYVREKLLPAADLTEMNKDIQSREAEEDLQLVIGGKKPIEREDIDENYIVYLTNYLLTQKYEQLPEAQQQSVSQFIAEVIAQANRKALKMQTQEPVQPAMPDPNQPVPPEGDTMAQPQGAGMGAPQPTTVGAPATEPQLVQ